MTNIVHRLEISALCPEDGLGDSYQCEIHTTRVIEVTEIIKVVDSYKFKKIYMEDLAEELRRSLCAKIVLKGSHYGRVETEVICL
jgi:heterodisulfide reductase subunit C